MTKAGDLLEPGKPVIEIAPRGGFRFEAAVPSEEVGRARIGLPARIKLDAHDYQRYGTLDGTVDSATVETRGFDPKTIACIDDGEGPNNDTHEQAHHSTGVR